MAQGLRCQEKKLTRATLVSSRRIFKDSDTLKSDEIPKRLSEFQIKILERLKKNLIQKNSFG